MNRFLAIALGVCMSSCNRDATQVLDPQVFRQPPAQYGVHTWWHWIDGAISKDGITKDLETMKEQGILTATLFNLSLYEAWQSSNPVYKPATMVKPAVFRSDEWFEMFRWALSESRRLGIKIGIHNCDGWSSTGGPWITPEYSMKKTVFATLTVDGGKQLETVLPQPEQQQDFYRDIALVACKIEHGSVAKTGNVINLTGKMDDRGKLAWDAPEGKWKIIRFGYTTTGETNHPASNAGRGLECDKMDTAALQLHFDHFPSEVVRAAADFPDVFDYLFVDSWECGLQTWTSGFDTEFLKRRGYSLFPYIAALCGDVVENPQVTECFLYDYRKTISELIEERYYAQYRRLCDRHNIRFKAEPIYGGTYYPPLDVLKCNTYAVNPMWEFWSQGRHENGVRYRPVNEIARRLPIHAAAVYGNRVVSAEAFTGFAKFMDDPWSLKLFGDHAFCAGVNQLVLHSNVHQPDDNPPGITLGEYGLAFNRFVPWFKQDASAWMTYLSRCQYLLQKSEPFAEVLVWLGDAVYQTELATEMNKQIMGTPYHLCNTDILSRMQVRNGHIIIPDNEQSYRLLILPDNDRIAPASLQYIEKLVREGATVYGRKPESPYSLLHFDEEKDKIQATAGKMWGNEAGQHLHSYGKGKVMDNNISLSQALAEVGVAPDFIQPEKEIPLLYYHKTAADRHLYFVVNQEDEPVNVECSVHLSADGLELWNPETGEVSRLPHSEATGYAKVSLPLDKRQAVFIVSGCRTKNYDTPVEQTAPRQLVALKDMNIRVQLDTPEPVSLTLDRLEWLNEQDDPRFNYFSGTAHYAITFNIAATDLPHHPVFLDLGDFASTCSVNLNGHNLGKFVFPGRLIKVDADILQSENLLKVDVSNNLCNSIIGNRIQYGKQGKLTTTAPDYILPDKEVPPAKMGLNGEISINII